jgi:hypothetical protein
MGLRHLGEQHPDHGRHDTTAIALRTSLDAAVVRQLAATIREHLDAGDGRRATWAAVELAARLAMFHRTS